MTIGNMNPLLLIFIVICLIVASVCSIDSYKHIKTQRILKKEALADYIGKSVLVQEDENIWNEATIVYTIERLNNGHINYAVTLKGYPNQILVFPEAKVKLVEEK
jgi:hypothetical protein